MAVSLTRIEFDAVGLRHAARRAKDADAAQRMLALALVLEGHTRTGAAETCGMDRQSLRNQILSVLSVLKGQERACWDVAALWFMPVPEQARSRGGAADLPWACIGESEADPAGTLADAGYESE